MLGFYCQKNNKTYLLLTVVSSSFVWNNHDSVEEYMKALLERG